MWHPVLQHRPAATHVAHPYLITEAQRGAGIITYNMRNPSTFIEIDKATGNILRTVGLYGSDYKYYGTAT
jgi:hypothetical protein